MQDHEFLAHFERMERFMADIDNQIRALTIEVTRNTSVEKSALLLINGFAASLDSAVKAAQAAGATATQLKALSDLGTTLTDNDAELAAAVANNTQVSSNPPVVTPEPPPPVEPPVTPTFTSSL
jgi:CHASE3 domain sensor protein